MGFKGEENNIRSSDMMTGIFNSLSSSFDNTDEDQIEEIY